MYELITICLLFSALVYRSGISWRLHEVVVTVVICLSVLAYVAALQNLAQAW